MVPTNRLAGQHHVLEQFSRKPNGLKELRQPTWAAATMPSHADGIAVKRLAPHSTILTGSVRLVTLRMPSTDTCTDKQCRNPCRQLFAGPAGTNVRTAVTSGQPSRRTTEPRTSHRRSTGSHRRGPICGNITDFSRSWIPGAPARGRGRPSGPPVHSGTWWPSSRARLSPFPHFPGAG